MDCNLSFPGRNLSSSGRNLSSSVRDVSSSHRELCSSARDLSCMTCNFPQEIVKLRKPCMFYPISKISCTCEISAYTGAVRLATL